MRLYPLLLKMLLLFAILLSVGCNQGEVTTPGNGAPMSGVAIGWMHGNCLAIKNDISPDAAYSYQVDLETKLVSKISIGKKASVNSACYALLEDRSQINSQEGRQFYTVVTDKPVNLAIGIVYSGNDGFKTRQVIDLNNDGKQDVFTSCSTSEGMMFSVWAGEAYKSKMIWSDYYYLGYDSEADCPDINW